MTEENWFSVEDSHKKCTAQFQKNKSICKDDNNKDNSKTIFLNAPKKGFGKNASKL